MLSIPQKQSRIRPASSLNPAEAFCQAIVPSIITCQIRPSPSPSHCTPPPSSLHLCKGLSAYYAVRRPKQAGGAGWATARQAIYTPPASPRLLAIIQIRRHTLHQPTKDTPTSHSMLSSLARATPRHSKHPSALASLLNPAMQKHLHPQNIRKFVIVFCFLKWPPTAKKDVTIDEWRVKQASHGPTPPARTSVSPTPNRRQRVGGVPPIQPDGTHAPNVACRVVARLDRFEI